MTTDYLDQLKKEKAAIEAKSAPLRKERDALNEKIQPTEIKIRELNAKIKELEQPHLAKLQMQIIKLEEIERVFTAPAVTEDGAKPVAAPKHYRMSHSE
jgi:TolA-binding protein